MRYGLCGSPQEPNAFSKRPDMTKKKAIYMVDGEPTKLANVKSEVSRTSLKDALQEGDYILTVKDVHRLGIKDTTIRRWRNSGKLRAKKIGATWFYSRQDLLDLIKTSKGC